MYQLKNIIAKAKGSRTRFAYLDDTNITLKDLFENYREAVLEITHPFFEEEKFVNIKDLPTTLKPRLYDKSVSQYLIDVNNVSLTFTVNPYKETNYVKAVDIEKAGYSVRRVNPNLHPDTPCPDEDKTALLISKEGIDPYYLAKQCVFTVNGILHFSEAIEQGVLLIDAFSTVEVSGYTHIGMINLGSLGDIRLIPVTNFDIEPLNSDKLLKHGITFQAKSENHSFENKVVLMSLSGFLSIPNEQTGIRRLDDNLIEFDPERYPIFRRYFDMSKRIPVNHIHKNLYNVKDPFNLIDKEEFLTDCNLRSIFSTSKTFFIVIDTPSIKFEFFDLEQTGLPGKYLTYDFPDLPLLSENGFLNEYWFKKEVDRYSISISDYFEQDYMFETVHINDLKLITNQRVPNSRYRLLKSKFIKMT